VRSHAPAKSTASVASERPRDARTDGSVSCQAAIGQTTVSYLASLRRTVAGVVTRSPHQRLSRALVKTLLYRVLMLVITVMVALFVTGNATQALSIGLVTNLVKTGTYYGYERLWDRISWGV